MNNPTSLEHNSVAEEEEAWSEMTATPSPSPPLSDTDDDSWILISNIPLEANHVNDDDDDDDDDDEEEEDTDDDEEEEEEEEEEDTESHYYQESSSSSSSLQSSSETFMSFLIRERILQRLPAKQLLELRRVSRQWNESITSPFFIHSHSQSAISISGVFYTGPSSPINQPSFNPFGNDLHGLRRPDLRFLPEPVAVLSSSRGLLCCKAFSDHTTTRYFIVNPLTGSWVPLPFPANDHGPRPAAVIVFDEPFTFNFSLDYKLVVAYDLGGCYGFEVFESKEWKWSVSNELCVTEWIEPQSGVAAGGCAHWRTSMQTVVSYNPEVDRISEVVWPESYRADVVWELGEIGGRLSCVCAKSDEVCVYGMDQGNGSQGSGWKEVRKMRRRWWGSEGMRLVRVQEVREVVVVEDRRVWAWSLEDGTWREGDWYVGVECGNFVSFVGSLLHGYGSWGG